MLIRILKIIVNFLMIISIIAIGVGLVLMLCLKNDHFKEFILPFYPIYDLSQNGIKTLENMRYSAPSSKGKEVPVGVLDINNESWDVMLEFVQSEIAFLKSERNKPMNIDIDSSDTSIKPSEKDPQQTDFPINWDRIKTISSARIGAMMVGDRPLTAPYRLFVIGPDKTSTKSQVYEFYSFEEFRLDMNKMIINKIEYLSTLMSIIGFITGLLATAVIFILSKMSIPQGDSSLQH